MKPGLDEFAANDRIKQLRKTLGLTRDEFAQKTGIGTNQLSNLEHKKQKVYAWHIEAVSHEWPQYGYWLCTGEVLPEAGQISPASENESRAYLKVAEPPPKQE